MTPLGMAVEAEALASDRSGLAFGLAPMLQGLAWAKIGDAERAKASLSAARRAHDNTDSSSQVESVFGFSVRRRLFYESRILTLIGDHKGAEALQRQALPMYPAYVVGDPALMSLDEAARLVAAKEFEAAASLSADALDRLPPAQRGRMFLNAARSVIDAIPRLHRSLPAVRASQEVIREFENSSSSAANYQSGADF
jgi:tetratricopeptide (TPR) repeat protein